MPAAFERCVKRGGRVRTISGPRKSPKLAADEFVRICFIGGKSFMGEKKVKLRDSDLKGKKS